VWGEGGGVAQYILDREHMMEHLLCLQVRGGANDDGACSGVPPPAGDDLPGILPINRLGKRGREGGEKQVIV